MSECKVNQLMPEVEVSLHSGQTLPLWQFRQVSHVVMILAPEATVEEIESWQNDLEAKRETWQWLGVHWLMAEKTEPALEPAVYVIDRYAHLIEKFSLNQWSFAQIEKTYTYYESCNC